MSEKMWLVLDQNVFRRQEILSLDDKLKNTYFGILLRAALNPWWGQRKNVVPCDKGILSKATGYGEDEIRDALNAFRKLGFVTLVKESELTAEDGSSGGVPTLEEVQAFAAKVAPDVDAQKFYEYYAESNFEWKGKPIDWKSKLESWQKTEKPKPGKKQVPSDEEYRRSFEKLYKAHGCKDASEYLEHVLQQI